MRNGLWRALLAMAVLAGTLHCGDDQASGGAGGAGAGQSSGGQTAGGNDSGGGPSGGGPSGGGVEGGAGGGPLPSALDCTPIECVEGTGNIVELAPDADLQAAIDAAAPGDTLLLPAGATFTGHFTLREKAGDACITLRTSTPDADLPSDLRVTPADAPKLARLVTPGDGLPALLTDPRAHHYRLVGLEIAPESAGAEFYDLVSFGEAETSASDLPHDIIVDRCFIHGVPDVNQKRGVGLDSARTCIIHSHISDFHSDFQDSQAIGCSNGSGPFRIIDNRLEASTENILFGGAVPSIDGLVPTDIVVRGNSFEKPLAWKAGDPGNTGYTPTVKNLFEIKNGRQVVLDGNVMVNNWVGADQHGSAILLTPRGENGAVPWAVVENVTISNNILRHVGGGVAISGFDDQGPSEQTNHIEITNNLFEDIRQDYALDIVRVLQFSEVDTLLVDHNTFVYGPGSWPILRTFGNATTGLSYTNNVVEFREGLWSECGENEAALGCILPGAVFAGNLLIGGPAGTFTQSNAYPADIPAVGFVDYAGGPADFHGFAVSSTSSFAGASTDGSVPGIDPGAIEMAQGSQ